MLSLDEYQQSLLNKLDELNDDRLIALDQIQLNKRKVEKAYNNHVKLKRFSEGNIVQKSILPLEVRDLEFGKWSPNWEGPFTISQTLTNKVFWLVNSDGRELD